MDLEMTCAVILITLFGLPHGALDPVFAYRHGLFKSMKGAIYFHCLYLLICLFMLALWVNFPLFSFVAFIVYSAVHFGGDWAKTPLKGLFYGFFVVSIPVVFHPSLTIEIFDVITFNHNTEWLLPYFYGIYYLSSLVLFGLIITQKFNNNKGSKAINYALKQWEPPKMS